MQCRLYVCVCLVWYLILHIALIDGSLVYDEVNITAVNLIYFMLCRPLQIIFLFAGEFRNVGSQINYQSGEGTGVSESIATIYSMRAGERASRRP